MLIRIEIGDWLKNASIVGMYKVLSRINLNSSSIDKGENYIEFDSTHLRDFTKGYFEAIADEYKNELTYFKITEKSIDNLTDINDINDFIKYVKEKTTSNSYVGAYNLAGRDELLDYFKKIEKIKISKNATKEDTEEIVKNAKAKLKEVQEILSDEKIRKYIIAKNAIYQVICNFFKDKSFMLKKNTSLDMYDLYQEDFVNKAIRYESSDKSKFKYECSCCGKKIEELSTSFSWLIKQGVDVNRKTNHFWDFYPDLYMCDTCVLLYSCACLGFNKKFDKGVFVNNNKSIDALLESNIIKVTDDYKVNNVEALAYFNIVRYMDMEKNNSAKYDFDNIQVVTMDTNSGSIFTFSLLTKKLLCLIYGNRRNIKRIASSYIQISENQTLSVFGEVMARLYSNRTLYDLIRIMFMYYFSAPGKVSIDTIKAVYQIEGGKRMSQKEIESFKRLGLKLKAELTGKKLEGKLSSLNYKLINALRANNSDRFLDAILEVYMHLNKDVPQEVLRIKFNDISFSDFGYSYLVGLNLELTTDKSANNENELKEESENEE